MSKRGRVTAGGSHPLRIGLECHSSSTSHNSLKQPPEASDAFSRYRALYWWFHPVLQCLVTRAWLDIAAVPPWSGFPALHQSYLVQSLLLGVAFAPGECA